MRTSATYLRTALCFAALSGISQRLPAQQPSVAGAWKGEWTSPEGYLYGAVMHLGVVSGDSVVGSIAWTLKRSPRPADQAKIGLRGTEYVRGRYSADCGVLRVAGYRLDDPSAILGMDRYALLLAETGMSLGGITWDHGTWTGQLLLARSASPD
jgi:hypothetical protein